MNQEPDTTLRADSSNSTPTYDLRVEWLRVAPKLLLAIVAAVLAYVLRAPIEQFLDRSTEIGIGPVSLKAAEVKLSQVKIDDKAGAAKSLSEDEITTLSDRYSQALAGGKKVRILWIDDTPENNKDLVDFLELIGVNVTVARSTADAIARLEERSFNAVVSDYSRPNEAIEVLAKAGGKQFWGSGALLSEKLANAGCGRLVIIFSGDSADDKAIPPGVVAQTNSVYKLLLIIADMTRGQIAPCEVGKLS